VKNILAGLCASILAAQAWAQSGGELRFALAADPKTLNPLQVTEESSDAIRYLTCGTLVRLDRKTFEVKPEIAESWKVSRNGRAISFKLRPDVRFSDGTPLDAEDIAFTLRRVLDPKAHVPAGDSLRQDKGSPEITVVNRGEVSLVLPEPVSGLEALFDTIPILSSRSPLKDKAGLGPFLLAEYKPGSFFLFKRNPHYWKKDGQGRQLPYLDSVRIEILENREIEMAKFRRGDVHLMSGLTVDFFDQIGIQHGAVDAGPTFDSEVLWFNQVANAPIPAYKKKWFQSAAFRVAISEVVQRADIVKLVYGGRATAAAGPFSPSAKPWANEMLKPRAFDPRAAQLKLAGEGFHKEGDALKDSAGNQVEFSLITNAGNRNRAKMASILQQDFQRLGIRLNILTLDMPSLIERITRNFQYETCLLGFLGTELDPNDQLNIWMSSSSAHPWNPHQAKPETAWEANIDRLMREQASTGDPKKRKALLDRMQEIVYEQAPMVYLVHPHALVAVSPKIGNAAPSVLRPRVFWNAEKLYFAGEGLVSRRTP
jgi:peptide/nickel transport system substrate-binding protein